MGTSKGYLPPNGNEWSNTKRAVTRMIKDGPSRLSVGNAISKFAQTSISNQGRGTYPFTSLGSAGSKAIQFFGFANEHGFNNALTSVGLEQLINKSNEEILIGLLDYFTGDGSLLEDNIVRGSMAELLKEYMKDVSDDENYSEAVTDIDMNEFIRGFIITFIQKSFLTNFSEKIETLCENIDAYIKAEKEIKDFIRVEIERKYTFEDLSEIDWNGIEGKYFISDKCMKAYEMFKLWKEDLDENMG